MVGATSESAENVASSTTMSGMPTSGSYRRAGALLLALAAAILAACAGGDGTSDPIETSPTIALPTVTRATTIQDVVETTAAPTTEAPVVTEATAAPTTEATVASTTSTTTTTTVPPTTTTEPISVQELVLRGDGLGAARFGADPDGVIDYVTSILGGNTSDTGWVDPFTFAVCDGTVARRVSWGTLSLFFNDLSTYASDRRHFMGWEYGFDGQIGEEPVGLRTPGGTTLGTRVVDLLADFPDASINEGDTDPFIPSNFYVSDVFSGLLTGTTPDDLVTTMRGGYGCGE